ncbi:MAG: Eco57I restriction-modification methylase domain-containing protein, partial [Minisyncoccia bacterium]
FHQKGGFDIVIANPPYGGKYDDRAIPFFKRFYRCVGSKNKKGSFDTFALFIEKGFNILKKNGNLIFITPISVTSSDSMVSLHELLENNCKIIKISSYAVRPQPVFESAVVNTSIISFIKTLTPAEKILLTKMYRKGKGFRLEDLLNNLQFIDVKEHKLRGRYPKISLKIEKDILEKLFKIKTKIKDLLRKKGKPIYYRTTGGRYFKVITNYSTNSTKEKAIYFDSEIANSIGAILSSNLFFWWYQIYSNNLDLKSYEIESFPIPLEKLNSEIIGTLERVYDEYLQDIERHANIRKTKRYANINEFKEYKIAKSKHLVDKIDDIIGPLYGLTNEEVEFIKNYEIEFRLSGDEEGGENNEN